MTTTATTPTTPPNMTVTVSTHTWLSTTQVLGEDVSTTITISKPLDLQIDTEFSSPTSSLIPNQKKPAGLTTTISTTTPLFNAAPTGTEMALGEEASATVTGMKPELTAPAGAGGKRPMDGSGSDNAPFTGAATSRQVVGWSIVLLVIGVVALGLAI
jgi:hypothetical protein